MIRALAQRVLALCGLSRRVERQWIPMSDGVRLATTLFRPDRCDSRTPVLLMRTPFGSLHPLEPHRLLAAAVAQRGVHAVLQDVRGRFDSEGRFTPFRDEGEDGEATIRWVEQQPWYDGRLAVAGFSYAGWAALAASSRAPERVAARIVIGAASDLHRTLRPGGAFSLAFGLRLALGLSDREPRRVGLGRALRHRPLIEADRVALCATPWFRDWLTHPAADDAWPRLPEARSATAPTLFVAGFDDPFTPALLADHAACRGSARLVLGPWPHPRPPRLGRRGRSYHRSVLGAVVGFLDDVFSGGELTGPPVRVVSDAGSAVALESWPPADARTRTWYLRSTGTSGRLDAEPGAEELPDRYEYDPEDPTPSLGDPLAGDAGVDRRSIESRRDVLRYTGRPLDSALEVMGPARVVLFVSSSAPDTDFVAVLADIEPGGTVRGICEGIVRCRHRAGGREPLWLEAGAPVELSIELGACCHRFSPGHRLRLEVSSCSLPRYDRNPNTREEPWRATSASSARAQQTLFHDAGHPSRLELSVRDPGGES